MNDPTPVTVTEIADLLARARTLSPPRPGDTAARAAFLAAKADLLARIPDQHAHDRSCHHADQARQVAADTRAMADPAQAVVEALREDSEDCA